jgi:hypothetical protein
MMERTYDNTYFMTVLLILIYIIVVVIVVFSFCAGCLLCVCSFVCCVSFDRCVILFEVCCLRVVSYCIVPLPPGENPFEVKMNNNNNNNNINIEPSDSTKGREFVD